jgi:hypothetical protein
LATSVHPPFAPFSNTHTAPTPVLSPGAPTANVRPSAEMLTACPCEEFPRLPEPVTESKGAGTALANETKRLSVVVVAAGRMVCVCVCLLLSPSLRGPAPALCVCVFVRELMCVCVHVCVRVCVRV